MSDQPKVIRDGNGRLLPGSTLNPGGRHNTPLMFRKYCRRIVDEKVIKAWEEELDARGDYWVKCSELLAAYGYGSPKQVLKIEDDERPAASLTTDELRALARTKLSTERRDDEPEPDAQH